MDALQLIQRLQGCWGFFCCCFKPVSSIFMWVADNMCRAGAEFTQPITCKIVRTLVKWMCFSVYLLNQATYWIAPKGQRFGPRHRHGHVGDALPESYTTLWCFLWNHSREAVPGPKCCLQDWTGRQQDFWVKPRQLSLISSIKTEWKPLAWRPS